jgi:hypothetical protein
MRSRSAIVASSTDWDLKAFDEPELDCSPSAARPHGARSYYGKQRQAPGVKRVGWRAWQRRQRALMALAAAGRGALLLQADARPADLVSRQKHNAGILQRLSNRINI